MEKVRTDEDDRPKQDIKITGATVFVNPYKEEEEAERKAAEEARLEVGRNAVALRCSVWFHLPFKCGLRLPKASC